MRHTHTSSSFNKRPQSDSIASCSADTDAAGNSQGFAYGRETPANPVAFPTVPDLQTFNSKGAFVDGVINVHRYLTTGVRYDWFHPDTEKLTAQWTVTPSENIPLYNGFQIIAEYQHRDFQLDATDSRQNDTFQVRVIVVQ